MNPLRALGALLLALVVLPLAACSDDDAPESPADGGVSNDPPAVGLMDGGAPSDPTSGGEPPVYVWMSQVYTPDGDRSVYLPLTDTLDVRTPELSITDAAHFSGVANFATIDGKVFVSSGEQPTITRYEITRDLKWVEQGSISFGAYPLAEDNANLFTQVIVDGATVIMPFDRTQRVIWSPRDMTIVKAIETASMLPAMRGADELNATGNRLATRQHGLVLQPFYYATPDGAYAPTSQVVVYDAASFEEASVIDVPCPGLDLVSRAEDGTTYLGSADNAPFQALYGRAPKPCVARITPEGTLDAAWTTDLSSLTGGLYTMGFRYLRDGKAIAAVIDHPKFGSTFTGPVVDPALEETLWEGGYARVWWFDLRANTAAPIAQIPEPQLPRFQTAVVDGRVFYFANATDYSTTTIYEIASDGVASKKFTVPGDVFKMERLR